MSSLRNAVKRITHKERAQPRARAHLGLLEKKKDYTVRAKDYHKKENVIKKLQEKASMKNPDEFYFGMHRSQIDSSGTGTSGSTGTGTGKHRKTVQAKQMEFEAAVGLDTVRIMKDQDLAYVRLQKQRDVKKLQKLQANLHFLQDDNNETSSHKNKNGKKRKHTIFVESKQEADNFDAAKHFDTLPQLVGRSFNRPRLEQLKRAAQTLLTGGGAGGAGVTSDNDYNDDSDGDDTKAAAKRQRHRPTAVELELQAKQALKVARKLARARNASYGELQARSQRIADMERAESHLLTEKLVSTSKGRKRKIKPAENGQPAVYQWRRKRLR